MIHFRHNVNKGVTWTVEYVPSDSLIWFALLAGDTFFKRHSWAYEVD